MARSLVRDLASDPGASERGVLLRVFMGTWCSRSLPLRWRRWVQTGWSSSHGVRREAGPVATSETSPRLSEAEPGNISGHHRRAHPWTSPITPGGGVIEEGGGDGLVQASSNAPRKFPSFRLLQAVCPHMSGSSSLPMGWFGSGLDSAVGGAGISVCDQARQFIEAGRAPIPASGSGSTLTAYLLADGGG